MNLNKVEKKSLLKLARNSIEFVFKKNEKPTAKDFTEELPKIAEDKLGVFVTLHKNGDLRGCIGYIEGFMQLKEGIIDNALNAAFRDPRFEPLEERELKDIDIEISIMSPIEEIKDPNIVEVGKHGLIISRGHRSGLLLPQVAPEWGWNRIEFLEHTCGKAGLDKNAWKDPQTRISVFSALVFGEKEE